MDTEQWITEMLRQEAGSTAPPPVHIVLDRARRLQRNRARAMAMGLGALLLVGAGLALAPRVLPSRELRFAGPESSDSATEARSSSCPSGHQSAAQNVAGWKALPSIPGGATTAVITVTTRGDIITVLEHDERPFAALLDQGRRTWTCTMLPFGGLGRAPLFVTTDDMLYLWTDNARGEVLAMAVDSREWRALPPFPLEHRVPGVVVWTGQGLLIWGGNRTQPANIDDGAIYSPRTGEWSRIAKAPRAFTMTAGTWSGSALWVVGSRLDGNNRSESPTPELLRYRPADDHWDVMPSPPISPQAFAVDWSADGLIAWDYLLQTVRFDTGLNRWEPLPALPFDPMECYPARASGRGPVVAVYCSRIAVLEQNDVWRELPSLTEVIEAVVRHQDELILMGSASVGGPLRLWAGRWEAPR